MELHAVQLINVTVEELFIKVVGQPSTFKDDFPRDFSLVTGRSDYSPQDRSISVRLSMEITPLFDSQNNPDRPFEMRVSLAGHFTIDESLFPVDKINHWAENNAPIILIPFIREHVYSMSIRAGVEPVLFPLIQVPTIKITSPNSASN